MIILTHDIESVPADTKHVRHLKYDLKDRKTLREQFETWVRESRAYQFKKLRTSSQVLKRGDIFNMITDATFYLEHAKAGPEDEIRNHILNRRLVPTKYLYNSDRGTFLWIELCRDPEYKYYIESIKFLTENKNKIFDIIGEKIIENSPDYISLGCGDGKKDQVLLELLLERQKNNNTMYYYPYDISTSMISTAIKKVCSSSNIAPNRLRIKAIEADFYNLRSFIPVYQYRTETNIFSLLGNTLGNIANETSFLDQTKKAMFNQDILLVEVRLQSDYSNIIGGKEELNKRFDFTPLAWFGVPYDPNKLTYSIHENRSTIPETKTIISSYREFSISKEEDIDSAYLSYVHTYNRNALTKVIEGLGFKILGTLASDITALFILQKEGDD